MVDVIGGSNQAISVLLLVVDIQDPGWGEVVGESKVIALTYDKNTLGHQ